MIEGTVSREGNERYLFNTEQGPCGRMPVTLDEGGEALLLHISGETERFVRP
jgi:hypothetical protein